MASPLRLAGLLRHPSRSTPAACWRVRAIWMQVRPAQGGEAAVLLADVRCLPGCEGAPVVGACGGLLGVLAAPLAHRGFQAEARCRKPVAARLGFCSRVPLHQGPASDRACWSLCASVKGKHHCGMLCLC